MKEVDLLADINTITTIETKTLKDFIRVVDLLITNNTLSLINSRDTEDSIALKVQGFGTFFIILKGNELEYRFKPSQTLTGLLNNALTENKDQLAIELENTLVEKFTNVYKELL